MHPITRSLLSKSIFRNKNFGNVSCVFKKFLSWVSSANFTLHGTSSDILQCIKRSGIFYYLCHCYGYSWKFTKPKKWWRTSGRILRRRKLNKKRLRIVIRTKYRTVTRTSVLVNNNIPVVIFDTCIDDITNLSLYKLLIHLEAHTNLVVLYKNGNRDRLRDHPLFSAFSQEYREYARGRG